MVTTRKRSLSQERGKGDRGNGETDASEGKHHVEEDAEVPQPVSSDSEFEDRTSYGVPSVPSLRTTTTTTTATTGTTTISGTSRLFAPYRSIGIISSGHPFHLIPHQNSQSAMMAVPIGDRFQLLQTDKLQPVLVSQTVPSSSSSSIRTTTRRRQGGRSQNIAFCVSDASLSITIVAHGNVNDVVTSVTLYHRTQPRQTQDMVRNASDKAMKRQPWSIVQLLHLGHTKVDCDDNEEKEGKKENAVLVAVVVALQQEEEEKDDKDHETNQQVPVVGDDNDADESESDSSSEDDEDDNTQHPAVRGQVILFVATRTSLRMLRQIPLISTMEPTTAVHPATYLNKIVVGGRNVETNHPMMCLINVRSCKLIHVFQCLPSSSSMTPSTITTLTQSPAVDTIAVGCSLGNVHLINLKHDKLLFSLQHQTASGSQAVSITSLSFRTDGSAMRYGIAPLAVGRSDGTITIWNLSAATTTTDSSGEEEKDQGVGREILCELDKVHVGGVAMVQYLPQEPLLLSIGTRSNAVIMHIFDNPDHSGRILKQRKGHTHPPSLIRYLRLGSTAGAGVLVSDSTDASTCQILSTGGKDRTLRVFSTARTVLDKEYSQGAGLDKRAKKYGMETATELLLPPVTNLALADSRNRDWGDLVTIHENHSFAYVWSTKRGTQSGPVLKQANWNISAMKEAPSPRTHATAVTMSTCGNFALVGTRGGMIYKYNVQSGLSRGSYPRDMKSGVGERFSKRAATGDIRRTMKELEKGLKVSNRLSNLDKKDLTLGSDRKMAQKKNAKLQLASHVGFAVTGLAVDAVNKTLISVGADQKLILWSFASHGPHKKSPFMLPSAAAKLCYIRESDLAAIALADFSVILFDSSSQNIVRRFASHGGTAAHLGPITDIGLSPDGRTLYTSSLDSTVRVFDVPTNSCVDWLKFEAPATSLTVSPTGEFLATTHATKRGISIWSDKSCYKTINMDGIEPSQPYPMDEPIPLADDAEHRVVDTAISSSAPSEATQVETPKEVVDSSVTPKKEGLVTLSGLPPAHWKNLFHLELVKERNKPQEPPKKPPSAPFFLQWRSGEPLDSGDTTNKLAAPEQEDEWAAAWSEDDDEAEETIDASIPRGSPIEKETSVSKRRKVSHHRSQLALLLHGCETNPLSNGNTQFHEVTSYITSLGPSAIDLAFSSLCYGPHDLDEGLPLLLLACYWLIEACESHVQFEAVNAYVHRFLFVHSSVLANIERNKSLDTGMAEEDRMSERERSIRKQLLGSITKLKKAQEKAFDALQEKMQHTLCLLRHFSRMV